MSLVVMPAFAAADTEVLRTECALKVSAMMPAFDSIVFSHLAMVDELTGWCGLIVAINSFEVCSLKASVRFSHARSEGRLRRKSLVSRRHGRRETAWYRLLAHVRPFPLHFRKTNVYVDCPCAIIYGQDIQK